MNISGKLKKIYPTDPQFPFVLEMDQKEFPRSWNKEEWRLINWGHHELFIWEENGTIAGFILLSGLAGDDTVHLLKICITQPLRGGHTAKDFWSGLRAHLQGINKKAIFLEVEAKNNRAIHFYHKVGFETLRTIKNFYSDGETAITMHLTL